MASQRAESIRSPQERAVWNLFTGDQTGGYQAFGICANPLCENPDGGWTCGRKPTARVCVFCFEFQFNCVHPTVARLEAMRLH